MQNIQTSNANLYGAVLMVAAMAGFAVEDLLFKIIAGSVPIGEILFLLGFGGAVIFMLLAYASGQIWEREILLNKAVLTRTLAEAIGTIGYTSAIVLTELTTATAILQAVPLATTLGASVILGETVGWRRWMAISVGFIGVIMVIRPGASFEPATLLALLGVVGLSARDLATRSVPARTSSLHLSALGFGALVPTGLLLMFITANQYTMPNQNTWLLLALALVIGVGAYFMIVRSTRIGEISVVAPFRYARIPFALILAVTILGERPDAMTLAGSALIALSGLYSLWRETRLAKAARRASLTRKAEV